MWKLEMKSGVGHGANELGGKRRENTLFFTACMYFKAIFCVALHGGDGKCLCGQAYGRDNVV